MDKLKAWFQSLGNAVVAAARRFMAGRYGTDKLNMVILCVGLVISLITVFVDNAPVNLILTFLSYGCLFFSLFRCFSRNTYKRYQENRSFLLLIDQIKDRDHRYFDCPRCRQLVRVPRGKGKISITCPKCKEKFVKKT